jgi:cleavage and polyadenylation specificity factor subunit 3
VSSSNEALRKRVEAVLDMAVTTVSSLTKSFTSGVPVVLGDEMGTDKEKGPEGQSGGMTAVKTSNDAGSGLAKESKMSGGTAEESDGDEEDEFGVLHVHG